MFDGLIFRVEQLAGKMLELGEPFDLLHALGDAANVRSRERALVIRTHRIHDAEIGALVCSRELPAPAHDDFAVALDGVGAPPRMAIRIERRIPKIILIGPGDGPARGRHAILQREIADAVQAVCEKEPRAVESIFGVAVDGAIVVCRRVPTGLVFDQRRREIRLRHQFFCIELDRRSILRRQLMLFRLCALCVSAVHLSLRSIRMDVPLPNDADGIFEGRSGGRDSRVGGINENRNIDAAGVQRFPQRFEIAPYGGASEVRAPLRDIVVELHE